MIACTISVSWFSEFLPSFWSSRIISEKCIFLKPCFGKAMKHSKNKGSKCWTLRNTSSEQFLREISSVSVRNKVPTIKQFLFQQLMNWTSSESLLFQFFQRNTKIEIVKCFFQVNEAAISFESSIKLFSSVFCWFTYSMNTPCVCAEIERIRTNWIVHSGKLSHSLWKISLGNFWWWN